MYSQFVIVQLKSSGKSDMMWSPGRTDDGIPLKSADTICCNRSPRPGFVRHGDRNRTTGTLVHATGAAGGRHRQLGLVVGQWPFTSVTGTGYVLEHRFVCYSPRPTLKVRQQGSESESGRFRAGTIRSSSVSGPVVLSGHSRRSIPCSGITPIWPPFSGV